MILFCRLAVLDQVLASRTFLVGERLSLADLAMATTLVPAFRSQDKLWSSTHAIKISIHPVLPSQ